MPAVRGEAISRWRAVTLVAFVQPRVAPADASRTLRHYVLTADVSSRRDPSFSSSSVLQVGDSIDDFLRVARLDDVDVLLSAPLAERLARGKSPARHESHPCGSLGRTFEIWCTTNLHTSGANRSCSVHPARADRELLDDEPHARAHLDRNVRGSPRQADGDETRQRAGVGAGFAHVWPPICPSDHAEADLT